MTILAKAHYTRTRDSRAAGTEAAEQILEAVGGPPQVVLVYQTINHQQAELLQGLSAELGPDTLVLGCSGQGVIGPSVVREEGYAASMMALGGEGIRASGACVERIQESTREKGLQLGRQLLDGLDGPPKVVVLHYDVLSGADAGAFMDGLSEVVSCPIVGGAAGHYFGTSMQTTYQYMGTQVLSHAAVAVALTGDFHAEIGSSQGCSPVGVNLTVTKAEGNLVLELDGRPSLEVWGEISGAQGDDDVLSASAVAIGVPTEEGGELIRAAFMIDKEKRGFVLQTAIAEGTTIALHHRTVDDVLNGSKQMAGSLVERLQGRKLRAALCFECGARTQPFLGTEAASSENEDIQKTLGTEAEWAGACVWSEVFPTSGKPGLHNYTYAMLTLSS